MLKINANSRLPISSYYPPGSMKESSSVKAYIAASLVVCIWSGWITISRYGVHTSLQPADITLLRYCTAFLCLLPALFRYDWHRFTLKQYLITGLGVGFPYTMLSFYGLREIKAAHAGVLVNGMLPVLGALAAWLIFRQKLSSKQWAAILLIFIANLLMAGSDLLHPEHALGILLLLGAASVYTIHMTAVRRWNFRWQDVLVTVATVNALIFLPIWWFLPHNLFAAAPQDIVAQAFYQGILVNLGALLCVAYAIKHLGTMTVALFMSTVPVATALLAWILLQEPLITREMLGIVGCSLGLSLYAIKSK